MVCCADKTATRAYCTGKSGALGLSVLISKDCIVGVNVLENTSAVLRFSSPVICLYGLISAQPILRRSVHATALAVWSHSRRM